MLRSEWKSRPADCSGAAYLAIPPTTGLPAVNRRNQLTLSQRASLTGTKLKFFDPSSLPHPSGPVKWDYTDRCYARQKRSRPTDRPSLPQFLDRLRREASRDRRMVAACSDRRQSGSPNEACRPPCAVGPALSGPAAACSQAIGTSLCWRHHRTDGVGWFGQACAKPLIDAHADSRTPCSGLAPSEGPQ